jgi:hypothetical protein
MSVWPCIKESAVPLLGVGRLNMTESPVPQTLVRLATGYTESDIVFLSRHGVTSHVCVDEGETLRQWGGAIDRVGERSIVTRCISGTHWGCLCEI